MKHSLLVYGSNAELLRIRQMVLRSAGHEVQTSTDPDEVVRMMRSTQPEVLILCHTLLEAERVRVLDCIPKISPRTKALVLLAGRRGVPKENHANLETIEGPRRLLEVVQQLASSSTIS